jgi:hypothetical protein
MAESFLELAERAWRGEVSIADAHPLVDPLRSARTVEEVAPDTAFLPTLANISAFRATGSCSWTPACSRSPTCTTS